MIRVRVSLALLAGTVLLGLGSAVAAGPYPPPSKGTGHVEPSRIKVGECAVFSGDGFAAGTSVAVADNGTARGTAVTDGQGEFSKRLCYPRESQRGRHDLAGSGTGADGTPLTVYAVLIVQGGPGHGTGSGAGPGAGEAGTPDGAAAGDSEAGPGGGASDPTAVAPASSSGRVLGSGLLGIPFVGIGIALVALLLLLLLKRRRDRAQEDPPALDALPA